MNPTRELLQLKPDQLTAYPKNSRKHPPEQISLIAKSIEKFGFTKPVLVNEERQILAGHGAWMAANKMELETIPVLVLSGMSKQNQQAYVLADNKIAERSSWDVDLLAVELKDLIGEKFNPLDIGFSDEELDDLLNPPAPPKPEPDAKTLAQKFLIPPFSVLNAREGWWQDRKRAWLSLGIQSELGRGEELIPNGGGASPGGSPRPACDYSQRQRGDGKGRPYVGKSSCGDRKGP